TLNSPGAGFIQFSGQITGGGALTTTNSGTYLMMGNNDYSGGTILGGGFNSSVSIGIGSDTALGTGTVNVNSSAVPNTVFFAANGDHTLNNALTITTDFAVAS